ncbi:hypothetical protein [Streptomyces brevispora]|uniref:Uncharacterized protein n=1 Tax=Streptomyces brevispora TaxID=887462 RepID=A0ABZ1G9Q5_9ACTN|nr:hypothetical protein [Streptomyces brevispora]WSC16645.1 hypothetical protein OIE64_30010 [Streptomyces brevispora]
MRAARAVASFCRKAGPPVRGRVKAPRAGRGARAEREAARVRVSFAVQDPAVAGVDREQPGGGGAGSVRVQCPEQGAAGAFR